MKEKIVKEKKWNVATKIIFSFQLASLVEDYIIPRVPECLSLRPNWLPPPPLPQMSVSRPMEPKEGQHSLAGEVAGGANFGRLERKPGTLSTRCPVCS